MFSMYLQASLDTTGKYFQGWKQKATDVILAII